VGAIGKVGGGGPDTQGSDDAGGRRAHRAARPTVQGNPGIRGVRVHHFAAPARLAEQ